MEKPTVQLDCDSDKGPLKPLNTYLGFLIMTSTHYSFSVPPLLIQYAGRAALIFTLYHLFSQEGSLYLLEMLAIKDMQLVRIHYNFVTFRFTT